MSTLGDSPSTQATTSSTPHFRSSPFFKAIATLGVAFYGQHSTVFIRAKVYLWLHGRGNNTRKWRHAVGVAMAATYHGIQFALGIISMPVAFAFITLWEYPGGEPQAEQFTDIGQWGPWAGAGLLAFAVILNTTSAASNLRKTLVCVVSKPAHALFPRHVERRRLPPLRFESTFLTRVMGFPRCVALFFIDEYVSTRDWLRDP